MPRSFAPTTIYKFGGAALADARAMRHAAHIVSRRRAGPLVVVASAMAGVTDALLAVAGDAALPGAKAHGRLDPAIGEAIQALRERHTEALQELELDA